MPQVHLAKFQAVATDEFGNIIPSPDVAVTRELDGTSPILYANRDGSTQRNNPFVGNVDGSFDFHIEGGAYRIEASKNGLSRVWRYTGVGTAAEYDANDLLFAFPIFWQAANKPGVAEAMPPIDVPLPLTLYNDFDGWYARVRTAPTSTQVVSIRHRAGASGASTEIATLTFTAGQYEGVFVMADDVPLSPGDQVWPLFPSPRDLTMADFSMCILARR